MIELVGHLAAGGSAIDTDTIGLKSNFTICSEDRAAAGNHHGAEQHHRATQRFPGPFPERFVLFFSLAIFDSWSALSPVYLWAGLALFD